MKRVFAIVMCVLIMFAFVGCGKDQQNADKLKEIVDFAGRKVVLPEGDVVVASNNNWISSQITMIAGPEAIAIAPASFSKGHTERFAELFPGTNDVLTANGDTISAEEMLGLGVNLFFALTEEEATIYSNAGISSIVMNYDTTENVAESFVLIGKIFGGESLEKATKIHDFFLDCVSTAKSFSDSLTERPKVYCIAATKQTTPYVTQGEETFTRKLFTMCGVDYITSGHGTYVTVSSEFIMEQDPDYIVLDGYYSKEAYEELVNDPVLKNLKAVEEGKIIVAPIGILRPALRPGAETGIGILWLCKTFYPEQKKNIDIENIAIQFYKDCFGWDISREEVENMLKSSNKLYE